MCHCQHLVPVRVCHAASSSKCVDGLREMTILGFGYGSPWVFCTWSEMGMEGILYPKSGSDMGMGMGLFSWVRVWGVNPDGEFPIDISNSDSLRSSNGNEK
jgi:hypothetical protein